MKILAGDKDCFAVEIEQRVHSRGWRLGGFRFWVRGKSVGDWDDDAALHACVNWLRQLVVDRPDRDAPALYEVPAEDVVHAIWDPYMKEPWTPDVSATFNRLSLSHVGMSSFEFWDVFVVAGADGAQRCVWRDARSGTYHDAHVPAGEIERVAMETWDRYLAELDSVFLSAGLPSKPRRTDGVRSVSIEQARAPGSPWLLYSSGRIHAVTHEGTFPTRAEAERHAEQVFGVTRESWRQTTQRVGPLGGGSE